jgi:SNF2 family DNA or RNA helicase
LAGLLADDMGLGKTHQVLALLSSLYKSKNHKPDLPSLVVAPTSVVTAWEQKLAKYKTGLKWHVFHGKERKIPTTGNDLILTTYGLIQRDPALLKQNWHMVILDEAQAIKNPQTLSAQKARLLQAKFRVVMTGTPVENSMTDLWSLMEFLLPGYLGSFERFKRLYVPREGMPSNDQAQSVRRLVGPFLLRRTKGQVLQELPEKTEEIRSCFLTPDQQKRYNEYLSTKEVEAIRQGLKGSGKIDYVGILAILTRLKQVCDHPELPDMTSGLKDVSQLDVAKSGKWESFEEIIDEALGSGLKVVVFTQYLGVMDLIIRELKSKGIGYGQIRGDTTDRGAQLRKFAEDSECKVFVCSLLAGGMGIDLTSASVCIHFDRWWNPAKENQATDRLHRIGQTRGVQVFKLQIPGTIEERISTIIEEKSALADALIEESAVGLKTFSRKELLDLLTQIPDEVIPPAASRQ